MARPPKIGLDYYPMDVGFLRDKKVKLLRSEFGASSVVFVLYVFSKVYEGDGYFLTWDKDELLLASDELGEPPTYISEVLQGCLSRSLFDERVFQMFGVLTSAGIQRRYLRGCEKRDVITIFNEYWLLDICSSKDVSPGTRAKLAFVGVNGGKNPVNSPGNPVNSPGNPQSKGKERKRKESKTSARAREVRSAGASTSAPRPSCRPVSVVEVEEYARSINSSVPATEWWDYCEKNNWKIHGEPMSDWKAVFRSCQGWKRWKRSGGENGCGPFSWDNDSPDDYLL